MSTEDSSSGNTFRELRDWLTNSEENRELEVPWWGPLIQDEQLRQVMFIAYEAHLQGVPHEKIPDEFEKTRFFKIIFRRHASRRLEKAINSGNEDPPSFLAGYSDDKRDISGLHTIQRLETWLIDDVAKIIYLAGHMGAGKTDFSHLMVEVVRHRMEQEDKEIEVRTNIKSSEIPTINEYPDLKEWMTEGSVDDEKWYIFDEASSELSGYSHDRAKVEQLMSSMVKKMRKNGVSLIIIGHTGMDLHPDLRRLSDYVEKTGTKTADAYASVKDGDGAGHLFRLDGIPETNLRYNTEDEAEWDWGDADTGTGDFLSDDEFRDWRDARLGRLWTEYEELSQDKLAEAFGVSKGTVNTACQRYVDGELDDFLD